MPLPHLSYRAACRSSPVSGTTCCAAIDAPPMAHCTLVRLSWLPAPNLLLQKLSCERQYSLLANCEGVAMHLQVG